MKYDFGGWATRMIFSVPMEELLKKTLSKGRTGRLSR